MIQRPSKGRDECTWPECEPLTKRTSQHDAGRSAWIRMFEARRTVWTCSGRPKTCVRLHTTDLPQAKRAQSRLCPILLTFETGVARDFGSDFSKNSANWSDFSEISQSYNHSYQNHSKSLNFCEIPTKFHAFLAKFCKICVPPWNLAKFQQNFQKRCKSFEKTTEIKNDAGIIL